MTAFKPLQAFYPPLASALMAGLLLHDLMVPPTTDEAGGPYSLFHTNSFHGGSWRCAYEMDSLLTAGYLLGRLGYSFTAADEAHMTSGSITSSKSETTTPGSDSGL